MVFGGEKVSALFGFFREFIKSVTLDHELPVSEEEAEENVKTLETICKRTMPEVSEEDESSSSRWMKPQIQQRTISQAGKEILLKGR